MKKTIDLSLYLVTQRGALTMEEFFHVILQSVEGGVRVVQLREKEASARKLCELATRLLVVLKPLGIPLIINDRVDVAYAIKADGVHLGQSDLKPAAARAILGKEAIIGLSVETLDQVIDAANEEVDYLAASPLFSTLTKTDCGTPWGLEGLKQLCSISAHPVIAIGGIDASNIADVFQCGAVGAAVVSSIFNAPCPKTAAMALTERIQTCKATY